MSKINSSSVIQKAVTDLLLQSGDKILQETLDKLQLVYSLNPSTSNFVVAGGSNTTGTLSITTPTVSTGARTFITGITASFAKDATCDVATSNADISIFPKSSGVSTSLLKFPLITLTAQNGITTFPFPFPIEVNNASNIAFTGSFTVGVFLRGLNVVGYTTTSG